MDLKTLIEKGAIVAQTPVTQTISWTHLTDSGEEVNDTFTVRIKKHSAGTIEEMWHGHGNGKKRSFQATLIAESILLGDGDEKFTYKQAYDLDPSLAQELVEVIDKVNPVRKREKKA